MMFFSIFRNEMKTQIIGANLRLLKFNRIPIDPKNQ